MSATYFYSHLDPTIAYELTPKQKEALTDTMDHLYTIICQDFIEFVDLEFITFMDRIRMKNFDMNHQNRRAIFILPLFNYTNGNVNKKCHELLDYLYLNDQEMYAAFVKNKKLHKSDMYNWPLFFENYEKNRIKSEQTKLSKNIKLSSVKRRGTSKI